MGLGPADRGPEDSDKFTIGAGTVVTQCLLCAHLGDGILACAAFPGGYIPAEILENRHDHRKPWIDPTTGEPGDTGIDGAESILFEPDEGVPESALAVPYRALDGDR